MTLCIQQDIVRLDISVYYAHVVYVFQRAAQLRNPEAHRLFCERFSRNVKAKVTARHEIDHKVSGPAVSMLCLGSRVGGARTYRYSMSWKLYRRLQRKG